MTSSKMTVTEEQNGDNDGRGGSVRTTRRTASTVSDKSAIPYEPSISLAVFLTWVLPALAIAILSRFAVDKEAEFIGMGKNGRGGGGGVGMSSSSRPITVDLSKDNTPTVPTGRTTPTLAPSSVSNANQRGRDEPSSIPTYLSNKPSGYVDVVQAIGRRRLDWGNTDASPVSSSGRGGSSMPSPSQARPPASSPTKPSSTSESKPELKDTPRGASSDPVRTEMMGKIERLREEYDDDTGDLYKLLELADLLRLHDVQYHDGGSLQEETIQRYKKAIELALERKQRLIEQGEETNRNSHGTVNVNDEILLNYKERSIDGILCAVHTALGKTYYMANMFERAVESYTQALEIEPLYLDAVSSRGSARIILGQFAEAAEDFTTTMENDSAGRFLDVFTGLARVLQARESSVPQGWNPMIENIHAMVPTLEIQYDNLASAAANGGNTSAERGASILANSLNRLYHVLFLYHDVKTNDIDAAWNALTKSYRYKMSALPSWSKGFESQKIAATKQIFHSSFWPEGVGSSSAVPIFIIGFVRSGSTLLERILDAHPQIVGTGENSVFNGRLDSIRNKIVEASLSSDAEELKNVISSLADGVVDEMRQRWKMVATAEDRAADQPDAERYVDKMLTNYYNVGFIHMLFPNALILHVAREPMDTIFSAYKHEFPSGTLDYTSQFDSLAELYHSYRDLIEHWDRVLPGRVTHVRYEDMVHDMPNIARKIIEATGLEWDDNVLEFHKKKQAVNTLSTTQVRKGIYKDSLQAWRRYETHLAPLVELIGARTNYDLKTSLKGYVQPTVAVEEEEEWHDVSDENVGVATSSVEHEDPQSDDGKGITNEEKEEPPETATPLIEDTAVEEAIEELSGGEEIVTHVDSSVDAKDEL